MDNKEPKKKRGGVSQFLSRFRWLIQAGATLLSNIHLPNLLKGRIYQGKGKAVCVPGLNCYSCPAASGACPIGSFQAVVGSSKFSFSYYITGFLILIGVLLGRFICGVLCPFGWLQELLHKIPTKKLSTKKLKPLTYIKYAVLLFAVGVLPMLITNDVGMGDPFFCKYLCPQGVLEGAIPLAAIDSGIRAALGTLFSWKLGILITVIVLSVLFYRPFCKWLCPLGAFYALLNKVSLFGMKVDKHKCISCGKCAKACKMDVDVTKTPDHTECIRCGKCIRACPTKAVSFRYGFGKGKENDCPAEKAETATQKIETEIEENPEIQGSNIKKDPSVKNIGSNDCIIRMRVTVSPKVIADYLSQNNGINYKTESWRYNNSDGFWYYLGIVSPGKATDPLFTEVNGLLDADGKIKEEFKNVSDFEITLYQEAVQAVVWDADGNELSAMDSNNKFNNENALKIWSAYKGSLN